MRIKKIYIVICALLTLLAVGLSLAMYYTEMSLAQYTKINSVLSESWTPVDELFVTRVAKNEELTKSDKVNYLGKVTYIANAKYIAYKGDNYLGSVFAYYGTAKMGDKLTDQIYFKPDDPSMIQCKVPTTIYLVLIIIIFALACGIVIVSRIINKSLKDNTFSDAAVSIMDIPILVVTIGLIACFFCGMFIGNTSVNETYTLIDQATVQELTDEANNSRLSQQEKNELSASADNTTETTETTVEE